MAPRHLKKRSSDVHNDADASFSSNRAPLRSVSINDNAAEKRRRRKSVKVAPVLQPEEQEQQTEPARSKARLLTSAAPPPVINVPLDVMSSNFEEWMKMATDNVRA
jgi:condensin complex subunit 2